MKKYIAIPIIIIAIILGFKFISNKTEAPIKEKTLRGVYSNSITFLNATTTNATSTTASINANVQGAKKATFYFQRGDTTGQGNTGTSTFSIQVSRTNSATQSDWITYNKLIDNVTNSISQNLTRVGSVAMGNDMGNGTSTKIYSMDLQHDNIQFVRCIVVETTDGEHSCRGEFEFNN